MIQYGLLLSRKIENPFDPYPTRSTPWFNLFLLHISGHETPPIYVCMNTAFIPTVFNNIRKSFKGLIDSQKNTVFNEHVLLNHLIKDRVVLNVL